MPLPPWHAMQVTARAGCSTGASAFEQAVIGSANRQPTRIVKRDFMFLAHARLVCNCSWLLRYCSLLFMSIKLTYTQNIKLGCGREAMWESSDSFIPESSEQAQQKYLEKSVVFCLASFSMICNHRKWRHIHMPQKL